MENFLNTYVAPVLVIFGAGLFFNFFVIEFKGKNYMISGAWLMMFIMFATFMVKDIWLK